MTARKYTKHPGSKRPAQLSYRGNAVPRRRQPHKGFHEKPGKMAPPYVMKSKKGAVWRAVTRPIRRLPGWQKITRTNDRPFSRPDPEDDA